MRYLGALRGAGVLKSDDDAMGIPAAYDFDGFLRKNDQVASCGEIRLTPTAMKDVFGRRDLRLLTADGRVLHLVFSEKKLGAGSDAALVDVSGELPGAADWTH